MVSLASRKVIFFCAGQSPTAEEVLMASRIVAGSVRIRRADLPAADSKFSGGAEPADAVAYGPGVTVPTAYNTLPVANGGNADGPNVGLAMNPATATVAVSGTLNLKAFTVAFDETTQQLTVIDVTTSCAWTSATTAKATVGAATGVVTGVEAGTSVIKASYTYTSGKPPIVATRTVTVTA